jgi:uncharacterized membrane protein HdeD (DUF308 family)
MNIFKNQIRNSSVLLSGILILILGILLFMKMDLVSSILVLFNRIVLLILCFIQLVLFFVESSTEKKPQHLWNTGFLLIVNVLLWRIPEMQVAMIPFVYGCWAMISAISKAMIYYVYRMDDVRPRIWPLIDAIISTGFAFVLLFDPVPSMLRLLYVAGGYLLYIGIFQTFSGIHLVSYGVLGKKINRLYRLPLPNFIAMLYPQRVLTQLKNLGVDTKTDFVPLKPNQLEILFHMKGNRSDNLGHVDMIYNNKVYSYGAHDPDNRHWNNSIGDGVLILSDPQPYLDFCITKENKRMIGFVYEMDEKQQSEFEKRMKALMIRTEDWIPVFSHRSPLPYVQRLSDATKADFYKFKQGYLKHYFAFGTNCVELVDHFMKDKNIGLFRLNGIITPGAYFNFLNAAYQLNTDQITQRRIY